MPNSRVKEPSEPVSACNLSGRVRRQELTDGSSGIVRGPVLKKYRVGGTLAIQGVLWSLHARTHMDTYI